MPTRVLDYQTPIKVLSQFHSIPSLLNLPPKIFGCLCYVHVHSLHRDKLDPRALKCVFLGYPSSQKGYKCFHPPSGKTYVSMDVEFCEQESYFSGGVSTSPLQGEIRSTEEEKLWFELGPCYVLPTQGEGETSVEPEIRSSSILPTHGEGEKPVTLKTFERRKKKHVDVPQPPPPDPSLHDTTIQSNDSSENDLQVHDSIPILSPSSDIDSLPESDHVAPLETPLVPHDEDQRRRYPTRDRHPPEKFGFASSNNVKYPISNYISYHRLSKSHLTFTQQLSSVSIPNKFQEALDDPKWKSAMVEEMKALQKNSTWEMVELPRDKKTVGCKWVFTVKQNSDGSIERYKARLVAKGYTQTYGIDYQETFAPVAKMSTIRVLLSLAANLDWPLKQFDVKNAFLHGDLQEEVYMDPPPGFTPKGGKICRLRKALYGLKQSPRAWFGRFSHSMRNYGFKQSQADHTLFLKRVGYKITLLIVYVDDMVVTGNDEQEIENLQSYLANEFEMKNLGSLKYFLGIEVARSKKGIFLSQRKYVLDLLAETGKLACEPINTPMEVNHGLSIYPDQVPTNKERYQRLVGKLIYLAHTRPDLSYAVSVVSQFMHNPSEAHQGAVDRILRYLKYTPGKGILFSNHGHLDVEGYTDSDFAGSKLDRKSTSGYVSFVGGNLVTWRSKKQGVVSRSSAEAEYRALSHGITELIWLKILMRELGFEPKKPMVLYCDNTAAIEIANNPVHHERTKHIDIDKHFISDNLAKGVIRVPYIKSEDQLADMMTHAVSSRELYSSLDKLGMCDIHAPT